ncbi:spore maturation protein [Heliobacillus mobilis]|uniref:Spore maturation protein n=1 Tax=Heliobacterium mobile TaxID=28064 RepID=A0A6I3SFA0_HELMO|nr:nucleoside recognition domain-containing protein [Heliobacterium mobile]MTV47406.1 spore maturation protein [Heliobacterium mobile]
MNVIWLFFLLGGIGIAASHGDIQKVTDGALKGAEMAVEVALGLIGAMSLWLGIMRIAQEAGLIRVVARLARPFMERLFPSIPANHPALGHILMNLSANVLGLGSAATPFGMKAMQAMQELNRNRPEASAAMCTFLAMNTSCITIVPATIISVRVAANSANPTEIVVPTILATTVGMSVALTADWLLRTYFQRRRG